MPPILLNKTGYRQVGVCLTPPNIAPMRHCFMYGRYWRT
nr:MAG TPA: hypothetical protein [Caudoviricetes sp.]